MLRPSLPRLVGALAAATLALASCASSDPRPAPPPRPAARKAPRIGGPLTTEEMQQVVSGAARLNRGCRALESPSGLYVVRLTIDPSGRVESVEPRRTPRRVDDPAAFSGVPRYLDGGLRPRTPVVGCFADAFRKLRFRRFRGPKVAFDYPIVVENLPPSEPPAKVRRCETDADCVFRPRRPCSCRPCGARWRRAINRDVARRWRKRWRKRRRRKPRCKLRCPPCKKRRVVRGTMALCIEEQCTVR